MSRSAYLSKLVDDARKGRKPGQAGETPEMVAVTRQATGRREDEDFGEYAGHGFPGGGAQSSLVQPADFAAGPLAGGIKAAVGDAAEALAGRAVPRAAELVMNPAAGLSDAAEGALPHKLASLLKAGVSPSQVNQDGQVVFKDLADWQKLEDIDRWRSLVNRTPAEKAAASEVTNVGHAAGGELDPGFDNALVKAKQALDPHAAPAPSPTTPGDVTNIAPGRAPVAAPAGAAGKVPVAPGQAPHPAGYSPGEVVSKQKDILNQYFESKGLPKYAHGGTVVDPRVFKKAAHQAHEAATPLIPDVWGGAHGLKHVSPEGEHIMQQEHIAPDELYHNQHPDRSQLSNEPELFASIADHVHRKYFAVGGVVPQPEVADPGELAVPAAVQLDKPLSITGVDRHPVTIDEQIPHPDLVPPPDKQAKLDTAATVEAVKTEGPGALEDIERQRRADLKDSEPGTGKMIARAISAGLSGFAGRSGPDFDAHDRAKRAEINAEADRRRGSYLTGPADELGRQSALADSPVSGRLRSLVGTITGQADLAEGMSALEAKSASPLIAEYLQAARAGDALRMQQAKLRLESITAAHKATHDSHMEGIAQQNADTNRLRLNKGDQKRDEDLIIKYNTAKESSRNAPDYQQVLKDELAFKKAMALAERGAAGDLSPEETKVLAGEMAKLASGSVGNVHLEENLSQPTLAGKYAAWKRYLTGTPGKAGYKEIIQKTILPYLHELHAADRKQNHEHYSRFLKAWEPVLPADFLAKERATLLGDAPEADPEPRKKDDGSNLSDLGGGFVE